MEAAVNVSSGHPFELFSSLQKKMSFWNSYFDFLSCSEPSKEARISTLTVNGQEIEIVVESCKYCAYFVSSKITSSWCKFMRSSFHHGSKDLFLQSKTKSCHLSNGITTVKHMFSPCITVTFPFWEISWGSILCNILHNISDIPKIPPFGIMWSWGWCISLVRILKAIHNIFMISCLLSAFRSGTNLKIEFWEDIRYRSFSIVISRSFFEEVFHLIQKFIVQRRVDSWILDDQTTIFMESFSDLFTLLGVVSCSIQEISYIYYGYRQS